MSRLTIDVVGRIVMSTDVSTHERFAAGVTTAFEWEMEQMTRIVNVPLAVPTPRNLRMQRARRFLRREIGGLAEERRRSGGDGGDLLSMLVAARDEQGNAMSERQLFDETITLCGAAQETSADAISWALYLLGRHPEVLAGARAEVDAVLGRRPLTRDDLAELPLCLRIFKEALRLYPPAPVMLRGALRDTTIGDRLVAKGTLVIISPWLLHRDPAAFPEPGRFDPGRWERPRERAVTKYAFLPFGAGRRVCVGSHLALMEGHVLLATLLQRAEIEILPQPPVEPVMILNLRPRDGIRVRAKRR
jgi:cytochrome P450